MPPRKVLFPLILSLGVLVPLIYGAQQPYSSGRFAGIQRKTREKVDMYLVNTPVTSEVPYFEISLEVGTTDYIAEYVPRHSGEVLPEAWKVGETVPCRVGKHRLYLQRPDGSEMVLTITKKTAVGKEESHQ